MQTYRLIIYLQEELQRRRSRNSHYSLRAFARDLGVDSSNLSGVLAGKKKLTHKTAQTLILRLEIAAQLKAEFVLDLFSE